MVGQRLRRQASNPYLFRTTLSATNQQSWSACGLENQAVVVCASRSRPVLLCGPSHLNHVKSGSHRNKTLSRFSNSTHFRVGENQFPVVIGSQSAARVQGTFWPAKIANCSGDTNGHEALRSGHVYHLSFPPGVKTVLAQWGNVMLVPLAESKLTKTTASQVVHELLEYVSVLTEQFDLGNGAPHNGHSKPIA